MKRIEMGMWAPSFLMGSGWLAGLYWSSNRLVSFAVCMGALAVYVFLFKPRPGSFGEKSQEVEVMGFDTRDGDFALLVSPDIRIYKGMRMREVSKLV